MTVDRRDSCPPHEIRYYNFLRGLLLGWDCYCAKCGARFMDTRGGPLG